MTDPFRDLSPLLNPRKIALVGASERHGSAGRLVLENLLNLKFPGKIYVVNPKADQVLGLPSYPDVNSLPEPVDMAAILLGADRAIGVIKELPKAGIPAAWMLASGFAEAGPDGKKRQAELVALCREQGTLLCGPNCVGVANLPDRSATYSVAIKPGLQSGTVSAVMQSGAILMGLANSARFGFRYLISSGNEAILDSGDYIGHLANDPGTRVILAFLEGIRDADKFIAAVRAARNAGKPVLALKVGRSAAAQRAVQAHTGSLAGSDTVLDAVFEREGVLRFNSLDELVEAAQLFQTCSLPQGDGVGMLSLSGGQIGLISDLARDLALNFPALAEDTLQTLEGILPPFSNISNPLDAWGSGDLENLYPRCVEALANDPSIHLIAMSRDTPPGVADREIEQSIHVANAAIRAHQSTGKPVFVFSNFSAGFDPQVVHLLQENHVAYLQGTSESLAALQAFEKYAAFKRGANQVEPVGSQSPAQLESWRERLEAHAGQALDEIEARRLLAAYGIQGPREETAVDEESAVELAKSIGFPVVMKILSPDILHKTEAGGVMVGLKDEAAVRNAFQSICTSAHRYKPSARIDGVIVQEMISPEAVEVILGIVHDPSFGPVVVCGLGGIFVEIMKDSATGIPPLSRAQAQGMIECLRGKKMLRGFRGRPAADQDALVDALVRLSKLACDLGDLIAALDINPLMVLPSGKGVRAVDSLVELATPAHPGEPTTQI